MNLPSDEEVLATLDRLSGSAADDLESLHLEFKPWTNAKDDMRLAVEYAVCFANAEGGVLVFGVADKVRGRAAAIHGAKGYDLDVWRRGIFDATSPHLPVEVKAAYTRTRGLNPIRYAEMVREYLRDHPSISNREVRELLGLGESPTAQVEASRYLKKWSGPSGFLTAVGNGAKRSYQLKEAS